MSHIKNNNYPKLITSGLLYYILLLFYAFEVIYAYSACTVRGIYGDALLCSSSLLCNQLHKAGSFTLIMVASNESLTYSFVDCLDRRSNGDNVNNAD